MRNKIDIIVIVCMFVAIYHNWTDFPKQRQEVHGPLVETGIKNENMDYK